VPLDADPAASDPRRRGPGLAAAGPVPGVRLRRPPGACGHGAVVQRAVQGADRGLDREARPERDHDRRPGRTGGQHDQARAAPAHRFGRPAVSISEQDEHLAEAGVVAEHGDYVAVDHTTEPDPPPPVGQEPAEPQLAFPDAATWVREWLRHNYKRRISRGSGNVWAADWW